jgi:alpha-glucosidase (family GH31 glycosyl hydrolase)
MKNKFVIKHLFYFLLLILSVFHLNAQSIKTTDTSFALIKDEGWWGGIVNRGAEMPFGNSSFSFDLFGEDDGNQAAPFLISSKGRYVWSDHPFAFSFKDGNLLLNNIKGSITVKQAGNTLQSAYLDASRKYFPTSGLWPDSLLITSPQYNLWIELQYNTNQKDILNYAKQVLANGMPPGVLMIDDNWSNFYGQFDFNKDKFPDAKALITELHQMGFKVMVWVCPFISPDRDPYRELISKKYLLMDNENNTITNWKDATKPLIIQWWNGYSACLDFSNPDTKKWLQQKLDLCQQQYGVDGFKFDAGDAPYYKSPNMLSFKKIMPNDHSLLWAEVGLQYPLNEYRAMWKMGGQPLVERLRDKNHSWEDLSRLIPNTFAQQLVGYTFTCPDLIGGGEITSFLPGKIINQKLMVRSAQCSALMPMMQFSAAPWRVLDKLHLEATQKIVALRSQKMPYIMQVMREAVKTGEPALRPLEYDFPNQGFTNIKDQFMLGKHLMVAPVVSENDTREVKFPKGKWKYNNKTITGPALKTFTVALDELLFFEKVK